MDLSTTPATAAMTAMARAMPRAAWEVRPLLAAMSRFVRPVLAAGRIRLTGTVPNGQWFEAAPRVLLAVTRSAASVDGVDLGPLGPLPRQARLGDFWLPQRGLFMVGESVFETFDPSQHHAPDPDTAFAAVTGEQEQDQGAAATSHLPTTRPPSPLRRGAADPTGLRRAEPGRTSASTRSPRRG